MAWRKAYICEVNPPPLTRRRMSTFSHLSFPSNSNGSYTFTRKTSGVSVCNGQPFTRTFPLPVRTIATATAVFLRPKHCTFSDFVSAIADESLELDDLEVSEMSD